MCGLDTPLISVLSGILFVCVILGVSLLYIVRLVFTHPFVLVIESLVCYSFHVRAFIHTDRAGQRYTKNARIM